MKRLTDTHLLLIGLVGLGVLTYVIMLTSPSNITPGPLSASSDDRDGALALRLWLEESGYSVRTFTDHVQLDNLDTLIVLNPPTPYSDLEARAVRQWVMSGGELIVAGNPYRMGELLNLFDVELSNSSESEFQASQTAPLLTSPPVQELRIERYYRIESVPANTVMHVADGSNAVVISFELGSGKVWVSGTTYPFTNIGLQDPNSPPLLINMLRGRFPGDSIGFDEALRPSNPPTLMGWLFNTPPGWGILLSMGLTMTFLATRGRRFGNPIPLPEDRLLREPVEYIQAIANLYRRSGQRVAILTHYKAQLRRQICGRYGLPQSITDGMLIRTVVDRNPDVGEKELAGLFKRLSAKNVSEQELVSVALTVDKWLRRHIG